MIKCACGCERELDFTKGRRVKRFIQGHWAKSKKGREKMSEINRGCIPWNKDKKGYNVNVNENNPMWKGDEVGYAALHNWIKRHKPKPEFCEYCNENPPYDLANISGEYKRDINDFEWLCRKCHMKKDRRLNKMIEGIKKRRKNNE